MVTWITRRLKRVATTQNERQLLKMGGTQTKLNGRRAKMGGRWSEWTACGQNGR